MKKNIIKLDESRIKNIIKMSLMEMLGEKKAPEKHLCGYLQMAQQRYGEFSDINLPEGVTPEDLENSDIKKMSNSLKPVDKWYIKAGPAYVIIRPDSKVILNAVIAAQKANPEKKVKVLGDKDSEKTMAEPEVFKSMRQVQDYVEKKYHRDLEFLTKTTKRGREWAYEARMTFVSASYADGPDEVPRELIDKISKWLAPFGFYYEGCKADHDERQWTNYGWHTWRRQGKYGTYDPYQKYLARHMYDDEEW